MAQIEKFNRNYRTKNLYEEILRISTALLRYLRSGVPRVVETAGPTDLATKDLV